MRHIKRNSLLILTTLVCAGLVVAGLELTNTTHLFHKAASTTINGINYGPPTKAEKRDSESRKDDPPATATQGPSSTITKKHVTVEITTFNAKAVSVNGFVNGVVESDGTCTLTLTAASDGKVMTGTHPGEANATNTTCGETTIPIGSLHAGTWKAVLSYNSSTSTGTSDPVNIEVQ